MLAMQRRLLRSPWPRTRVYGCNCFKVPRALSSRNNGDRFLELYDTVQAKLLGLAPTIGESLEDSGFCVIDGLLEDDMIEELRNEAEAMNEAGKFGQSFSEIADETGVLQRMPKQGVFSMELNGDEVFQAPICSHSQGDKALSLIRFLDLGRSS